MINAVKFSRNIATKFSQNNSLRRLSSETESELNTWIRINDRMHLEAAAKAEHAVSGVKADVATLRSEVGTVKSDVATLRAEVGIVKADVTNVRNDINNIIKGQAELHKQNTNSTRLLLTAMFGTAGLTLALNKYFDERKVAFPPPNAK
jgi:hypothetical protein